MASAPPEDPAPEWAIREGEEELDEDEEGDPEVEEVIEDEEEEKEDPAPSESDRLCAYMSNALFRRFDAHVDDLVNARKRRQEALAFRSAVEDGGGAMEDEVGAAGTQTQDELDGLGVKLPTDVWQGDCNMRTLDKLLARVDARGFERSAQQLEFHQAFKKAAARVIYRGSWETDRPMIMEKYGWERCNSEVLISTPRRFGKTFSIAIFCACLALALGLEIVVFSPARRASRKLLERIVEFIRLAGGESKICEYNQEACRLNAYDGKKSLIRSFPSKVGVSFRDCFEPF